MTRAMYAARAGAYLAMDKIIADGNSYDSVYACGIELGKNETPESVFGGSSNNLDGGSFAVYHEIRDAGGATRKIYGAADESARIDIRFDGGTFQNVADYRAALRSLSAEMTDDVVSAMIDWQDADSNPLDNGAEDSYYRGLDKPYTCKNAPFESVEEIQAVKGMTRKLYNDIKDYVTVYTGGKVNINTAPAAVLFAIIDKNGQYKPLVDKIVSYRAGADTLEGTSDDQFITDIAGGLHDIIDMSPAESARLATVADKLDTKSSCFRITSSGRYGGMNKTVTYVAGYKEGKKNKIRTIYYHED